MRTKGRTCFIFSIFKLCSVTTASQTGFFMKVKAETPLHKNNSMCQDIKLIPSRPGKPTGSWVPQAAPCGQRGSCRWFCSWCFIRQLWWWHTCKPQHAGDRMMLWLASHVLQSKLPFCTSDSLEACSADLSFAGWTLHARVAPVPHWALFQGSAEARLLQVLLGPSPLIQAGAPH